MPAKQVIVVRKDLNMRKGKIAAQASHASMSALIRKWRAEREFIDNLVCTQPIDRTEFKMLVDAHVAATALKPAELEWYYGNFRKICCYVESEAALDEIHAKALAAGLTSHLIIDRGLTEFNGMPTKTCVGIGPHFDEELDPITGHLPLL